MDPSPVEEPAAEQPSVVMPAQRREPEAPEAIVPAEPARLAPLVPSTPPAAVSRRAQAGSRFPLWLAVTFGVMSLLCVGALGVGYHYYNKATAPDRSTPAIAVQNYLQAILVDRSNSEAEPYACSGATADLAGLKTFRDQAISYATARHDTVAFSWTIADVDEVTSTESLANVTITQVTSSASGAAGQSLHPWILTTVRTSGWRVCGARQAS